MPPLLQSAQLKPDVTITSADSDNEIEDSDDDRYFLLEVHSLDILHVFMHVYVVWDYLSLVIFYLSNHFNNFSNYIPLCSLVVLLLLCSSYISFFSLPLVH